MSGLLRNSAHRCITSIRTFTRNAIHMEKVPVSAPEAEVQSTKLGENTYPVNNMEKRFLVWTGKYKTVNEIPSHVAPGTVEKARSLIRIRFANIMMLVAALGCLGMVVSGKRAAERGETIQKTNIEWHKRVKEEDAKAKQLETSKIE